MKHLSMTLSRWDQRAAQAMETVETRLRKARASERPGILHGIYAQVVESRRGRKASGVFRDLVETDSIAGSDFARYLEGRLVEHGMPGHAARLREQYSGIPAKPTKSWIDMPNRCGSRDVVEELLKEGNSGMFEAAFGMLAAAIGNAAAYDQEHNEPQPPEFLYPIIRQYPFDETMSKIVSALAANGFDVPGIKTEFHSYGPGGRYKYAKCIEGADFMLYFRRGQGPIGSHYQDCAGVSELHIPGKHLQVFEDYSGPRLYLYVGTDWAGDRDDFLHGSKSNSKLMGKPRTYLVYSGSWQKTRGGCHYPGKVAPFLVHDDDLGREYGLGGSDPKHFETKSLFRELREFFEAKLAQIRQLVHASA